MKGVLFLLVSLVIAISALKKRDQQLGEYFPLGIPLTRASIVSVYEDYTISDDDFTVIVKKSGVRVTLTDYEGSKGRMILVKNEAEEDIFVKGTLFVDPNLSLRDFEPGIEQIVHQGKSVMFQNDGSLWYDLHL